MNAYTYAGKAIDKLRAQLKNFCPGNLQNVTKIASGIAIKDDINADPIDNIMVLKNRLDR